MRSWSERWRGILAADFFYRLIITAFVIEALWIAFSARYPMAFDENYHFGLIQLYSHQLSPFFRHEPAGASILGDVTRYPSYLFHYLLSFLYRLIEVITKNTADQIVALRIVNVFLFASGLALWKKVFRCLGVSGALGNVVLVVLILLPQIPFLAGQINYDNLLFPLTALSLLLTAQVANALKAVRVDAAKLLWLIILALLTSLVKYTFLPIMAGLAIYLGAQWWRQRRTLAKSLKNSWTKIALPVKMLLITALILSGGLFIERYGYNVARYHELVPDCGRVIGTDPCLDYGPWARNFHYAAQKTTGFNGNPLKFTGVWAWRMWQQPFFVIRQDYATGSAFLLPEITAGLIFSGGLVALLVFGRRLAARRPHFSLLLVVVGTDVAALWLLNFAEYHGLQQYTAIQARYLFPIFPALLLLLGWAITEAVKKRHWQAGLALVVILLLLQGGGVINYMSSTNPSWWWPKSAAVRANQTAQAIIKPFLIERLTVKAR